MKVSARRDSLPSKTSDADALNRAMKPFFTQQQIDASRAALASLNRTSGELTGPVLNAIAAVQHVPAAQLIGPFASQFPALTKALIALPDATEKVNALTATFERNIANFNKVAPFHFLAATWVVIAAGLLVMVGGAIPLLVSDATSPLPTLDSTRILAHAALRRAVQQAKRGTL